MLYTIQIKKAIHIMYKSHKDDLDKGGYPYVFHPFFLAAQMDDEDSICVSLLHDVIEDHSDIYSFDNLKEEGFNENVMDALKLLTHNKKITYMDYIKAISNNPISKKVKIADLKHNLDTSRNDGKKSHKYDTYLESLDYLNNH